ncbi:hypothetical protein [Novosphingobium sp. HII-3]|uniref:hypothetical protein n=1 Tax=Novosphingobium sp. HII-3 TaxID=2075565 RepID=UPI000CDA184D|nr:hypothetical protein [Novosphingobium sp. HII-3]
MTDTQKNAAVEAVLVQQERWLADIADLSWDEIVADGGVTAWMVIQQEARTVQLPRVRAALTSLPTTEQSLAGEAVAYRYVYLDYAGRKVSRYGVHTERVNGHDPIEVHPLYDTPQPAPYVCKHGCERDALMDRIHALSATPQPAPVTGGEDVERQAALVARLRASGEPVHDRIWLHGIGDDAGEVTWANEPDPSGEPEEAEWAVEYVLAALSPSAPEAPSERGVGDWHPRIGEEVRPSENMIERWPDWRDTRLWVVGVTLDRNVVGNPTRGLNVCVSDEWPVTNRTGGFTDGFYINRDHVPDDLVPLTRARKIGGAS